MAKTTISDFDPRPRVASFIERLLRDTQRIARANFSAQLQAGSLADAEAAHLARVLDACDGNKSEAARILQIDRRSLQRKLARKPRGRPAPRKRR